MHLNSEKCALCKRNISLSEQLNAERVLAKNFHGLCTRLKNKILGYNLCMVFNSILGEFCDIEKMEHLIS